MLTWLACRFAPKIPDLTAAQAPALPDPSPHDSLAERAQQAFAELAAVPYRPQPGLGAHDALLAMSCRDLITREADQHPDTAGRTPNYAPYPAFEEVSIPGSGGVTLQGRRSTGAPGAPVIIVAHGLYDSHVSRYVTEYAEVLRRWGFHVVALDLRDHGRLRGKKPPGSLGLHEGKDLFEAARTLSEAENVSVGLLGFSFGGYCAVRAAFEASKAGRPEVLRGGVLAINAPLNVHEAVSALDDPSRLPQPTGLKQRLVVRELRSILTRHLHLRIAEAGKLASPASDYASYIREIVLKAYPDQPQLVGAFLGNLRCTQASVMGAIACPVALVHSVDDMLVPPLHMRQALAEAKGNPFVAGRELPGGGHLGLGVVDPAGTLGLLAAFFGRLRDG